jgi:sugar phosphate isomerase/epimerase
MTITRRQAIIAATAATAYAVPARERYQLGCVGQIFRSTPVDESLERIRRAGYRYLCPGRVHAGEPAFTPEMTAAQRTAMKRKIQEAGLTPCMSLGGFFAEPGKPAGLARYLAELDLCAEFAIPVMVGGGPWFFEKFPNLPKRNTVWQREVSDFYAALEKAVKHAEDVKVTIALKPHTGITATARACQEVVRRIVSPRLRICWDAGNVSFYEGYFPDPDLPDIARNVASVCIKDHLGGRAAANFPVPGQGQIDHPAMFQTLFAAGFEGPMAVEKVEGQESGKLSPEALEQRLAAAYQYLAPLLDRASGGSEQRK